MRDASIHPPELAEATGRWGGWCTVGASGLMDSSDTALRMCDGEGVIGSYFAGLNPASIAIFVRRTDRLGPRMLLLGGRNSGVELAFPPPWL